MIFMRDPRKIKMRKNIKFPKLREVTKDNKGLPENDRIKNVFKTAKGLPPRPNSTFGMSIQKNSFKPRTQNEKPIRDTYGRTMRFKRPGVVSRQEFRSVVQDAGSMGFRNAKKQKNLKPWGDFDGDGLANMLDSDPRNSNRQSPDGAFDDAVDNNERTSGRRKSDGRGGARSPSPERFDPETIEDRRRAEDEIDTTVESVESGRFREGTDEERQAERSAGGFSAALGRGIETVGRGIARERRLRERRRIEEQNLRARAARQARAEDERRRQRQLVRIERERQMQQIPQRQAVPSAIGGAFGTIGQVARTGRTLEGIKSASSIGDPQSRIMALTSPRSATMTQAQPVAPPRAQRQREPEEDQELERAESVTAAQRDADKGIKSPYSNRKVSYIRGPYKTGGDD